MSQPDLNKTLAAIRPKSKSAILRPHLPIIIQQIEAGVKISEIINTLKAGGLIIAETTLKTYLYRYRHSKKNRQVGTTVAPSQTEPEQAKPAVPVSVENLERLMRPDPEQEAAELQNYERIGRKRK